MSVISFHNKNIKIIFLRDDDDDDDNNTVRDVTSRDSALLPAGRSRHVTAAVPRVLVVVPGWVG